MVFGAIVARLFCTYQFVAAEIHRGHKAELAPKMEDEQDQHGPPNAPGSNSHGAFVIGVDGTPTHHGEVRFLGVETDIMRFSKMSVLLTEENLAVEARQVELAPYAFYRALFKGCNLISIYVTRINSNGKPVELFVVGKCRLEADAPSLESLSSFKERMYGRWPDCIDICPFCANAASPNGSTEYYVLMYPVADVEALTGSSDKVCWKAGMLPRLACTHCLEGLLDGPRIDINEFSSTDGHRLRSYTQIVGKIPLEPLTVAALPFLQTMLPSYPYLDRNRIPMIEQTTVHDFRFLHLLLDSVGLIPALQRSHQAHVVYELSQTEGSYTIVDSETATFRLVRCEQCGDMIDPTKCAFVCGLCEEVKYCGRPCQKAHWKARHRQACTAYDHIHCEQCTATLEPNNVLSCSACDEVVYCGRPCQKAHWKAHHKQACTGWPR